jgi:proteic killer suppression protein
MDFADRGTRELYNGIASKVARRVVPAALRERSIDKLTLLDAAVSLDQLRIPPGNRLEALHGNRVGQHSIRINDQYRICFRWTDAGATDVEIVDYHS